MKEFYIDNDGISLHAKLDVPENAARCPLAIVFHGLTGHMEERHIVAVAQAMNEVGVATLRVELYGHGGSGGTFAEHTLFKWVTNALAIVDYAKALDFVDDLYLCGHSQGGLLTMLIAGMRPDDFGAIIPLSPACVIPDAARSGSMFGIAFDPAHIPDVVRLGSATLNGNYLRVAQTIHAEEYIDRYKGPVLLVHGERDEAVPYRYSVEAQARYAQARLVTIPDDNHGYSLHLDMVTQAVKDFLSAL